VKVIGLDIGVDNAGREVGLVRLSCAPGDARTLRLGQVVGAGERAPELPLVPARPGEDGLGDESDPQWRPRAPWAPEPQEPRAGTFAALLLKRIRRYPGLTSTELSEIALASQGGPGRKRSPSQVSAAAGRLREAGLVDGIQTWCRTRERRAIGWFPREVAP